MCCVNKTTPIHFINGKSHIKQLKAGKSHTCLTNHTWSMSHHIMPLVINALGSRHTHRHTNTHTKEISRNQMYTVCRSIHAWLKHHMHNVILMTNTDLRFSFKQFINYPGVLMLIVLEIKEIICWAF